MYATVHVYVSPVGRSDAAPAQISTVVGVSRDWERFAPRREVSSLSRLLEQLGPSWITTPKLCNWNSDQSTELSGRITQQGESMIVSRYLGSYKRKVTAPPRFSVERASRSVMPELRFLRSMSRHSSLRIVKPPGRRVLRAQSTTYSTCPLPERHRDGAERRSTAN